VLVRQGSPVLGGQGSPYLIPEEWQLAFGYRWQRSDRHFTGDHEERHRRAEGSEVINDVHILDFSATYAVTERLNATLSLPVLFAERSNAIRDADRNIVGRNVTNARGIGDMILMGGFWLLDPVENPEANISLGLGVKFPTGQSDVRDNFRVADGTVMERTVDQSIQPGDGGFGFLVDLRLFTLIFDKYTLYAQGTYLFNPRNTSGVPTFRSRQSEAIMSVADTYLGRLGVAIPLFPKQGVSLTLGGRIEGVPVRDLIGDSDGFRRPGTAVSFEPGLVWVTGRHVFSLSAPLAVYRNRHRSVTDRIDGRHGDAAFADYLILFGYSLRLGGTRPPPQPVQVGSPFDEDPFERGQPLPRG
jgi:hypothetical protein